MQLGFLTNGSLDDVIFAAREGFDCLELALFGDTPLFDSHHEFKQALADHPVRLKAVSLFGQNYFHDDSTERRTIRARLQRATDLTAALGAPLLITGTGTPPGADDAARVMAAVEGLRPAIQEGQSRGLAFAFYNCHWENVIDRPSAWERALPELPGVGIKFDPSHPIQDGRDWRQELLLAGPRLVHAHAKDVLRVAEAFIADPNPGLGDVRWEAFFGILYHVGFQGAVCIEPHSALYTGERRHDFLRLSARYLRQFVL